MSMLCYRVFGESWVGRERWNAWRHFELLKETLPFWPEGERASLQRVGEDAAVYHAAELYRLW